MILRKVVILCGWQLMSVRRALGRHPILNAMIDDFARENDAGMGAGGLKGGLLQRRKQRKFRL